MLKVSLNPCRSQVPDEERQNWIYTLKDWMVIALPGETEETSLEATEDA